jgi:glycerol-3-phosphate dehydrogenase (NAD(P)+)
VSAFQHIGVLGAGAWGSALANVAARAGRRVTLWARDPRLAETIAQRRESPKLPGVRLADSVAVTAALDAVDAAALLVAGGG